MSSTNNSNAPEEQTNHNDPTNCIDSLFGTSLPSPVSTPASVANRRYLETVNENGTTSKKRSFEWTDTVVEEQESHGAMTPKKNVKRAKRGPSAVEMLAFLEEHNEQNTREMTLDDLQQAYDKIVNKQQCTEERKNDPIEVHRHSISSSESHVYQFYHISLVARNSQSAVHAEYELAVDKYVEDVSNTKQNLAALKRVEAMIAGDLERDSKDEKNEIEEIEENLREDMQNQREYWDNFVNMKLEKFQKPLLTQIEMKKAEQKNSTQHQTLADVRNRIKEYKEKLLQEERAHKTMDEKRESSSKELIKRRKLVTMYETIINCLQGKPARNEAFAEAPYETLREVFNVKNMSNIVESRLNYLKKSFANPLSIGGHPKKEEIAKLTRYPHRGQAKAIKLLLVKIFFGEEAKPSVELDDNGSPINVFLLQNGKPGE